MINKNDILKGMIDRAETEIIQQEVMIAFYADAAAKATDEETKNKYAIKQSQLQSTVDFNKLFVEYVKSL